MWEYRYLLGKKELLEVRITSVSSRYFPTHALYSALSYVLLFELPCAVLQKTFFTSYSYACINFFFFLPFSFFYMDLVLDRILTWLQIKPFIENSE